MEQGRATPQREEKLRRRQRERQRLEATRRTLGRLLAIARRCRTGEEFARALTDLWSQESRFAPDGAAGRSLTCFVAGVRDRMAVTGVRGIQRGVQLSLSPARAHAILGLPMHELGNTMVDLAAVLGRDGALLPERLAEAPTWRARFEILAAFLERRLADGPAPDPGVERALRWLAASGGDVRIGELADRLGWTRRHLARRFREQVGLSPKTVARVLRFERVTDLLADGAPPTAGLAAAAGYADQAHLCREIREFARCTPGEYAASLRRTAPDLPVMSHLFNSAEGGPG